MSRRRWSMRTYLGILVAVPMLAGAVALGYGLTWGIDQARDESTSRMSFRAQTAASAVGQALEVARDQVESLAAQPNLSDAFDRPEDCSLVAAGGRAFPDVRLEVVGADGQVGCSSQPVAQRTPGVHAGSAWLERALAAPGTVLIWDGLDPVTGAPAVVVASPVPGGRAVAVIFLDRRAVAPSLASDLSTVDDATLTVVDRPTHDIVSTSGEVVTSAAPELGNRRAGEWVGVDGARRIFGSAPVTDSPWRVYAGADAGTVVAAAVGGVQRQALIGVVALLGLALAAWVLDRRVAEPLAALTEAVLRARAEPTSGRVVETGTAEIAALGRQFNAMLDVRNGHEAQLAHQATHDLLTGLPNASLLHARLDDALHSAKVRGEVAVLCIGLLRLDALSDSLGSDLVDEVLVEVSRRLVMVVGDGATVARAGQHEFVVVRPDLDPDAAAMLAARLHEVLRSPLTGPVPQIDLTVAVGIAVDRSGRPEQLLRAARTAKGHAGASGADWSLYEDSMRARAAEHREIEQGLRVAVQRDELSVHYQPLVDVTTGRTVAAEALVRWTHPRRGAISPAAFIPIAEETGQVAAIGRFVLEAACLQGARWAAAGEPVRMSVNVAADQLRAPGFLGTVQDVLRRTGLPARRLCLEVTESSLLSTTGPAVDTLSALRDLGVHIAIDDFGTGYSALSYLQRLPVDELKIDRSFIGRIDTADRDRHLVAAIIGMARALDLTTVAEGVETAGQLAVLTDLGCDVAQGYHFARPQPAALFPAAAGVGRRAVFARTD